MEKSADAFRTISEVAADLVLPQHVLRFWETRFPQIRPLKRAGGRRYYRPGDVLLLRTIRQLLYDEGYTIKGVQRLLKEQGARGPRFEESAPAVQSWDDDSETIGGALPAFSSAETAQADPVTSEDMPLLDRDRLREALACVEDCQRILLALRRPRD